MHGYNHWFPKREMTPTEELIYIGVVGMLTVGAVVAWGITKTTEWIMESGGKDT